MMNLCFHLTENNQHQSTIDGFDRCYTIDLVTICYDGTKHDKTQKQESAIYEFNTILEIFVSMQCPFLLVCISISISIRQSFVQCFLGHLMP